MNTFDPASPRYEIGEECHFDDRLVRCYTNRDSSILQAFERSVLATPDADAVVDGDVRLSFIELSRRSKRVASGLGNVGIRAGDRVAIAMGNHWQFVVALVAIWRVGAIAVAINIRESEEGFRYIMNHCGVAGIFVDHGALDYFPARGQVASLGPVVVCDAGLAQASEPWSSDSGTHDWDVLASADMLDTTPEVDEEDAAVLLYTSGTTGAPKGAVLTHFNIIHTTRNYEHAWHFSRAERAVLTVPASHVTGIVAIISTMLVTGGCTVMQRRFDAVGFLDLASREAMTWTILVPAMYNLCLLHGDFKSLDLKAWRVGGFGGAPMPAASVEHLAEVLPQLELLNAYGSTETTSVVTTFGPGAGLKSATSVGQAVPCCDIRVVKDGRDVQAGEPGEVWLKGPNTIPGYWNDPKRTAAAFVDGYWRSGDIGALDEDGCLVVFDRMDDVINRGGYKVYGVEIENLLTGMSGIQEAAVIGYPDSVLGEKIRAFVLRTEPSLDVADIQDYCATHLANYKTPDDVVFITEALPRNPNGKILKRRLREDA